MKQTIRQQLEDLLADTIAAIKQKKEEMEVDKNDEKFASAYKAKMQIGVLEAYKIRIEEILK